MASFVFSVSTEKPMKKADISSQVDGIENTFSVPEAFTPNSLRVYYNGLRMTDQFTVISSTEFTLTFVPTLGTKLEVDYTA